MFALLFTVSHAAIFINAVNAMAQVVLAKLNVSIVQSMRVHWEVTVPFATWTSLDVCRM